MNYTTIYKVLQQDNNSATIVLSDKKHPIFKAHFPIKPVLPGFLHFEIVSELFDIKITNIKKAKFMKIVSPKQTLIYKRDTNKFKVFHENDEVASFSL